jgi:hypothetical protein
LGEVKDDGESSCPQTQKRVSAMAKNPTKTRTQDFATNPNRDEEIRRRAYEIYEARGREDGHDLDDWLLAEEEINATDVRAVAA